jgi:hypothetical protein
VLEGAGLIARGRAAQWRPCRLEAGPRKEVAGWAEPYRRFREESSNGLDDSLGLGKWKSSELKDKNREQKHGAEQPRQ